MKRNYIFTIAALSSTITFSQIDAAKSIATTKVDTVVEKVKDTAKAVITEKITEKMSGKVDSIPAAILNNKEDIQKNTKVTLEEYFSFEGKNGNQIFLKKLSNDEVLIFEDFANEELKTKMLSLDKENISEVFGVVYKPLVKEVGTKKLDGDGEQVEKTISKVFEMISATAQEKH